MFLTVSLMRRVCLTMTASVVMIAPQELRDIDGHAMRLFTPAGIANLLLFVASDCPISNGYAPEIQRICRDYSGRGVQCTLIYEDLRIDAAAVRRHRDEYRYSGIPSVIDSDGSAARRAGASVTPQALVIDAAAKVRYRGRIDNFYAALGQPRPRATVHDLRDALDAVIAFRRVTTPETEAIGCFITHPKDIP
jgi:AhpC/TSA family protein